MGGSQPGYLHFLDRLPTADQRLRRSKIQVIRITRGSGKSLCLFAVRVHQAVSPFSCQDYSRRRRSPSHRRRGKQPCRRRGLQRKPRCHGVPGSTRRQPSGNLPLRADVWNQQYRRIPRHCPRTCLVETERFRHAHLQ